MGQCIWEIVYVICILRALTLILVIFCRFVLLLSLIFFLFKAENHTDRQRVKEKCDEKALEKCKERQAVERIERKNTHTYGEHEKSVLGKLPHLRWHSQMLRNHWNVLGNKMNACTFCLLWCCVYACVCVWVCLFELEWLVFYLYRVLNVGIKLFYHVLVSVHVSCATVSSRTVIVACLLNMRMICMYSTWYFVISLMCVKYE